MPDTMIPTLPSVTGMPAPIAQAVAAVMSRVKSLPKGETNQHANYAFASIDDFLAAVNPLCAEAGLIITMDEVDCEILDRSGKAWVKLVYAFGLAHSSGAVWDRTLRRTIIVRMDGAQCFGSAQSYSLKQFMRSLFQIPTGDRDDADFHPKEDMPTRQPPQDRGNGGGRPAPAPAPKATQRPADESTDGKLEMITDGNGKPLVGKWVRSAVEALVGLPTEEARRAWLERHDAELSVVIETNPEWAAALDGVAVTGERPKPKPADDEKTVLESMIGDLRRAQSAKHRDLLLHDYGPVATAIIERRPDLQPHWLNALDTVNKNLLQAAE